MALFENLDLVVAMAIVVFVGEYLKRQAAAERASRAIPRREVTVRPLGEDAGKTAGDLLALVATFPPGTRSKEDIDRQLAADRAGWNR